MRIEYMDLASLVRWPRNPKGHDLGALHQSMGRFGFVAPILIDEATGRIVAGHGRLDALQQAKASGAQPPERIMAQDGQWLVPVIREVSFPSETEAEAYLVADNQLTLLGAWDEPALAQVLSDLAAQDALAGTGFDQDDVDDLLKRIGMENDPTHDPGLQIDRAEELQQKWGTTRGQLWGIGKHRLMCGDSTSKENVGQLFADASPNLMVTDPPYGVDYDPKWRERYDNFKRHSIGKVQNDDRVDWSDAWKLFPGDVVYTWSPGGDPAVVTGQALIDSGYQIRNQIIWRKQHFVFGRGVYHYQHEPCWYAVRKGRESHWIGDRNQSTVWDIQNANPMGGSDRSEKTIHGAEKPVECMRRPIRNHGGNVYDPFLGSGTTMIAAEQLGRICYGMEIEPKYVAVALERMAAMGLAPRLVDECNAKANPEDS